MSKKSILLAIIFIFLGILFTSCGSNVSIAKRHYNKGYYIARSKGNNWELAKDRNVMVETREARTVSNAKKQIGRPIISDYAAPGTITNDKGPVASSETRSVGTNANRPAQGTTARKHPFSVLQHAVNIVPAFPTKSKLERIKKTNGVSAEGDALSLFWIVIVVILILWLIGFLADGFGLGGLIHILLLVAAVLLVLWLLRII